MSPSSIEVSKENAVNEELAFLHYQFVAYITQ